MGSFVCSILFHIVLLWLSSLIIINPAKRPEGFIEVELVSLQKRDVPKKKRIVVRKRGLITKPSPKRRESRSAPSLGRGNIASYPMKREEQKREREEQKGEEVTQTPSLSSETAGDILVGTETEERGAEDIGKDIASGSTAEIKGEVARRPVLYQPIFKLPEWVEERGLSLFGEFKFWVLPDGSVDRVSTQCSFGYTELDTLAHFSILKWRFLKLPKGLDREEWGVATIRIHLR